MTAITVAEAGPNSDVGVYRDTAKVVHVEPIVHWREVPVERWSCKARGGHRRHRGHHDDQYGDNWTGQDRSDADYLIPTVLGGVAGGVVGSQVSDRGTRVVTTAAGSAAGALLGYGLSQVGHDRPRHRHHNKRCRMVTEYERQRQVDGYRVTYRYRGHEFTTRTDIHPGRRIPVRVRLRPQL